ncbi:MAG TPA: biopolymer transporter ExbD [Campylobacterales bacterium]|nr:biopolymer transporter ExbD [Campylobacterales bacterium]
MSAKASEIEMDEISDINMTPFVDIVLVILIIFMATATLIAENRISVLLPPSSANDNKLEDKDKITFTIDASSAVYADGVPASMAMLPSLLKDKKAAVLRADAKTNFEAVIAVIDECKKAGVSKYQIDTSQK